MGKARWSRRARHADVVVLAGIALASGAVSYATLGNSQASPQAAAADRPAPKAHAVFYRASSLDELKSVAPVAVVADVLEIQTGPTQTFDADKPADQRSPSLPSDHVTLRVVERLRGDIGDEIVWWVPLAPGRLEIEDDPQPRVGERYLLFLQPHPSLGGRWAAPVIDGKLRIEPKTGALRPRINNGVGAEIASSGLIELREALR
jgi:hypothetical protein